MAHFSVKAIDVKDTTVRIGVWITEPQQSIFYDESNVALQLLWDAKPSDKRKKEPLGKEISADNILDPAWVPANEAQYISSVSIPLTKNYPVSGEHAGLEGKALEKFWATKKNLPYAEYEISVTDPKWIAHISKGQEWSSSAINYEM